MKLFQSLSIMLEHTATQSNVLYTGHLQVNVCFTDILQILT